jgi:hypothetical protein
MFDRVANKFDEAVKITKDLNKRLESNGKKASAKLKDFKGLCGYFC